MSVVANNGVFEGSEERGAWNRTRRRLKQFRLGDGSSAIDGGGGQISKCAGLGGVVGIGSWVS